MAQLQRSEKPNPSGKNGHKVTSNRGTQAASPYAQALDKAGITRQTAHRWQELAAGRASQLPPLARSIRPSIVFRPSSSIVIASAMQGALVSPTNGFPAPASKGWKLPFVSQTPRRPGSWAGFFLLQPFLFLPAFLRFDCGARLAVNGLLFARRTWCLLECYFPVWRCTAIHSRPWRGTPENKKHRHRQFFHWERFYTAGLSISYYKPARIPEHAPTGFLFRKPSKARQSSARTLAGIDPVLAWETCPARKGACNCLTTPAAARNRHVPAPATFNAFTSIAAHTASLERVRLLPV